MHYPLKGLAGGMIIFWKEDWVNCVDVIINECTMSYICRNCKEHVEWMFTGVYCRGNKVDKTILWEELEKCRIKWGGKCIVGGDFNMTLRREERSGNNFSATEASEFII